VRGSNVDGGPRSESGPASGPRAAWLKEGGRLHLQHGPIDLIIGADGRDEEKRLAYAQAGRRFQTVLAELVAELPSLRRECPPTGIGLQGATARRMEAAVLPFSSHRISPMAAVAGAVADDVLGAMTAGRRLDRAYVNNGGDIAFALAEGQRFEIAMVGRPDRPVLLGRIAVRARDGIGGVATSGRHGRSFSLGIADSVTVLADHGADADAAATLVANAVDLPGHAGIHRVPARALSAESDLGDRLVTVDVAPLGDCEIAAALDRGAAFAGEFVARSRFQAAALCLGDQLRIVGDLPAWRPGGQAPMGSGLHRSPSSTSGG
jgi:ApbE superfamily uncharacterized protein (UPF0280 family)